MPSHVPTRPQEKEPAAASLALLFPCPGCGKRLTCRAELAGRKVKCPCGRILLAPQDRPGATAVTAVPLTMWRVLLPSLILAAILVSTFVLKLHNLGHTALTRWDEAYHAVVARNVLKHPLKPTLIDVPYLPYDGNKWGESHVWLHKPILPFWQIALCFAILGVNAFALRLPSALLSTGAAWLTYLIGKELLDRRAALIAAALQAANPFLLTLVQGYLFADHTDVALLFWVEVGVYFLTRSLRTGSGRDMLLAGVAQGLAYLCKSYLAGIILGIALTAWLLPLCRLGKREDCRIGPARLLGLLGATLLTVAPWVVYCLMNYPQEFWHEDGQVWQHLNSNIENWAAPWDRVVFDYLIAIYGVFYTPILVAMVVLLGKALAHRHTGLWLVYAWGLGVILPHLVAVTKTPSATVIGMPPLLLLLGYLVSEAWRGTVRACAKKGTGPLEFKGPVPFFAQALRPGGRGFGSAFPGPLAALTAVLALSVLFPAVIKKPGYGYPSPRVFGAVMRQSWWVIDHVAGVLALVALMAVAWLLARRRLAASGGSVYRFLQVAALVFCLSALGWLGIETGCAAWRVTEANVNDPADAPPWPFAIWSSCRVTEANVNDPASMNVGLFARDHLPDNAVLLCEERRGVEHLTTMFYADRTCYALGPMRTDPMARQVLQAGGIPYIVAYQPLPLPAVYGNGKQGPTIYLWQPR